MRSLDNPIHVIRNMIEEAFTVSGFEIPENVVNVRNAQLLGLRLLCSAALGHVVPPLLMSDSNSEKRMADSSTSCGPQTWPIGPSWRHSTIGQLLWHLACGKFCAA